MEESKKVGLISCGCGCGELIIPHIGGRGEPVRFKQHHQNKSNGFKRRDAHMNWKGGRVEDKKGYILVLKPEHPFSNAMGYIREHRLVYEEYYKCCLLPATLIHHINENKQDNRIKNLQPMTKSDHKRHHKNTKKDMSDRLCSSCKGKSVYGSWYNDGKEGFLCKRCYTRYRQWERRKNATLGRV